MGTTNETRPLLGQSPAVQNDYFIADFRSRRTSTRVKIFCLVAALVIIAAFGSSIHLLFWRVEWQEITTQAPLDQVLNMAPLIDGHNDFPIWTRAFYSNHIYAENFTETSNIYGQVDFPRLSEGRLRGQFWSVYVECPKNFSDYTDNVYYEIIHDTLQQIDLVHRLIAAFPTHLKLATSSDEVWKNFHSSSQISSLLGIEGLHQIANSASVLRMYHRLGVRYITLTHECHTQYADSATPSEGLNNGISHSGEKMIIEMNRVGIMVDLSHTSHATQVDALRLSSAPVIFSHSSAFTICPHERNVQDDVLRSLKKNDGVVMISFYPQHTHCKSNGGKASLLHVADHIQYVGNLIGYRHVGIGSDFDGMPQGPKGLEDVSKYPDLVQELITRGVPLTDLGGVIGGNVLRVLESVEKEAERLNGMVLSLEDDVKPFFS